jgi:hypothetical protein
MKADFYIPPRTHPLFPYIQSIWRNTANGDFTRETILPKGNVDLLFNLADPLGFEHAAHYYDQAHFCRDFKEIAGMSPSEYRARAGHVPGHLFSA